MDAAAVELALRRPYAAAMATHRHLFAFYLDEHLATGLGRLQRRDGMSNEAVMRRALLEYLTRAGVLAAPREALVKCAHQECTRTFRPRRPWQRFCGAACRYADWDLKHPRRPTPRTTRLAIRRDRQA